MNKYFYSFLFCITIVASAVLSSCSDGDKEIKLIGVSQCSSDLWRETVNSEILRQASMMPDVEVIIKSADDDSQRQIRDIEEFMRKGVDLLIVSPNESEGLTPIVEQAYLSGIPVILFDRKIGSDKYTAYVGADNTMLATRLGQYSADLLRGSGNVVIIRGLLGSTPDRERYEGFMSAIEEYPDIHVVAERYGEFLKDNARDAMNAILSEESEGIDLVFAMNDQMAMGVREAYDLYPGKKLPIIIGIDAISGYGSGVEAISAGRIDASFMYPTGGYRLLEVADAILNGRSFDRENLLQTAVVDKSNVRVVSLQNAQISEQQSKVDILAGQLAYNTSMLDRQISISRVFGTCLIVFILLVVALVYGLRKLMQLRNKLYRKQEEMNGLYRQLEEATQAKLLFFTDISHEFKTPLTLILGPVDEMLKSGNLSPEEHESMKLIRRNGNKLMNLLNQILEFRTYENGKMALNAEVDRLDLFLDDINRLFLSNIESRSARLEFITDGADYNMAFDKDKMDKIYFNFLSNALKYVNMGGIIRVSLRQLNENGKLMAELSIFNTGSFISEKKRNLVFKRFYHIDNSHGNSGIGLALSKSLIEIHGGTVWVESDASTGTTFKVMLPVVRSVERQITYENESHVYIRKRLEEIRDDETAEISSMKYMQYTPDLPYVLVIEDNSDMRQYIRLVLSNSWNVILARDGREGIEMALKYVPSLIIADIMMPEIDGFEVCRRLKANPITSTIPIICLTACATDEQKMESYASGADAYMSKPFNANVLRVRVGQLIEKNPARTRKDGGIQEDMIFGVNTKTLGESQQELLKKFRTYVEEHIYDNISISNVAEALGMSRSTLYRQFKEIIDANPVDVITVIRLRRAIHSMLFERKTVAQAAFDAGFSSPSYFTKTFIKYFHEKPSDYQKRYTAGT